MAKGKDNCASKMGRKGGLKGGPARASKLTKKAKSDIASKGAKARNKKYGNPNK